MRERFSLYSIGFMFVGLTTGAVHSADFTWNGAGTNDDWSTTANWGGSAPANNGTATTIFAGNTRLTPNIDANWSILGLSYASGASPFTIGGNALTIGAGGITNSGSSIQTLTAPIVVPTGQSWSATSGKLVIGSTSITTDTITLGANQLTLSGNNGIDLHGAISGTGGSVVKSGSGTLTITPNQTFTGGFFINGGTVDIGGSFLRLGPSNSTVTLNGGAIRTDNTTNLAQTFSLGASGGTFESLGGTPFISGKISGNGQLIKTGAGNLRLSNNNNDYSGGTLVSAGTLLASGTTLSRNVTNHGTVEFSAASTYSNGTLTGTGTVRKSGTGTLGLMFGSISTTGALEITGGSIDTGDHSINAASLHMAAGTSLLISSLTGQGNVSVGNLTGEGSIQLGNSAPGHFTLNHASDITSAHNFSGGYELSSTFIKNGAGTLTLAGNNSALEELNVNQGVIRFAASNSFPLRVKLANTTTLQPAVTGLTSSSLLHLTGTTTVDTGSLTMSHGGTFGGTGSLTKQGTGTLALQNSFTVLPNSTTVSQGTLKADGITLAGGITNHGVVEFAGAGAYELGSITGSGNVIKTGTGTLALGGSINASGQFNIQAGTAELRDSSVSASSVNLADGTTVALNPAGLASASITGPTLHMGSGSLMSFNNGGSGALATFTTLTGNGSIALGNEDNSRFTLALTEDTTLPHTFSGGSPSYESGLIKQGTHNLTLTGNNSSLTYLEIQGGSLSFSDASQIGNRVHLKGTSVLAPSADLTTTAAIQLSDTPVINTGSHTLTLSVPPAGNGSLSKLGEGTLAIDLDPVTFTNLPATTVSDGKLRLFDGSLDIGTITNAGEVELSGVSFRGVSISGAGTVRINGTGATLSSLGSFNSISATSITVDSGAFSVQKGSVSTPSMLLAAGTSMSLSSILFDNSNLNANQFWMEEGSSFSLSNSGTVASIQSLGGNGTINLGNDDGASLIYNPTNDSTLAHSFAGGSPTYETGFTKEGGSNLTLTGDNSALTYLEMQGGTLNFSTTSQIGSKVHLKGTSVLAPTADLTTTVSIQVSGTPVINTGEHSLAFSGVFSGSGTLAKQGTGTLALQNSFTVLPNSTTVSQGTLKADGITLIGSITNHGVVEFAGANFYEFGSITGSGNVNKTGAGTLTLNGSITSAQFNLQSGSTLLQDGSISAPSINLGANTTVTLNPFGGTAAFFSGTALHMESGSSLILNNQGFAANATFTTLTGNGTITLGNEDFSRFTLALEEDASFPHTFSGGSPGSEAGLIKQGNHSLTLTGNNSALTYLEMQGGALNFSAASQIGSKVHLKGTSQFLPSGDLTIPTAIQLSNTPVINTGEHTLGLSGNITDTGSLTKQGSGTLVLTGSNNYSGGTTVSAGTLRASGGGLQGTVSNQGIVELAGTGTFQSSSLTGAGSVKKTGIGNYNILGTSLTPGGGLTIEGGTMGGIFAQINSPTTVIESGAGLVADTGSSFNLGVATVNGTLNIANNEFGGGTGSSSSLDGSGQLIIATEASFNTQAISGSGTVILQGDGFFSPASFGISNNEAASLSWPVTSNGPLSTVFKSGAGTLTIDAAIQGVGLLSLSGGATRFGNAALLDIDALRMFNSSILEVTADGQTLAADVELYDTPVINTGAHTLIMSGTVSGMGSLVKTGSGSLILSNPTSQIGNGLTINEGTLELATIQILGAIQNSGILRFNATGSSNVQITGPGEVVKIGGGYLALEGFNNYSGNTSVEGGTLAFTNATLDNSADVILSNNGVIDLSFFETDFIGRLIIDGEPQATGLWGAPGNTEADFTSPRISGSGLLRVQDASSPDSFGSWIAQYYPEGPDREFDADPDYDGIPNGIEFVIGAIPRNDLESAAASLAKLPTFSRNETQIQFVFRRTHRSIYLNPFVEHGGNLVNWHAAVDADDGVTYLVTDLDTETDLVTVTIPLPVQLPSDTLPLRYFARLAVSETPP